jgi:hypothetical protein
MAGKLGREAIKPNPALKSLGILVGKWETVGSHPLIPGVTLHGHTSFDWLEGGAFLIMHSEIDEVGIPSGIAIFGSDDATGEYFMIYFDERGISRKYEVSMEGSELKWWRNAPGFSQRLTAIISDDGNTVVSKGELSKDDSTWAKDLELTYARVK